MDYTLQEATDLLAISPETLYDWSKQLAPLLSASAQPEQAGQAGVPPGCYTEADIGLLRQVKDLLSTGQTYDQVRLALSKGTPPNKPKRASRRSTHNNGTAQAPKPSENPTNELMALQTSHEQIIAAKDQQIAELENMLQVALFTTDQKVAAAKQQRADDLENLSREIEQLQAENQALREQLDARVTGYTPSYSFQLKILLIMALVAALIAILIELLFNPNFRQILF